jgi:hypothetical protein
MPPTNETPHRHAKKASPARRKSKPKFEVPTETSTPETANGWVYRADEVPEPPEASAAESANDNNSMNPLLVAGMGFFFLGVGTVSLMSLAAVGMLAAPFRFVRNIWPGAQETA